MTICVARAGKEIGRWPVEELPSLMDTGTVQPTDFARVQGEDDWLLVSEHPALGGKPVDEKAKKAAKRAAEKEHALPEKNSPWLIALVVGQAVLLVVGVVSVLTGYGLLQTKKGELEADLQAETERKTELEKKVSELQAELFQYRPVEKGFVEGRLAYRVGKKTGGMPGAEVVLFRQDDVRRSLLLGQEEMQKALPGASPGGLQAGQFYFKRLSPALKNSLTDASGYFRLPLPEGEGGEYVLASRGVVDGGKKQTYFWLVSFDAARAAERPIILNADNAIQRFDPAVMVVPAN